MRPQIFALSSLALLSLALAACGSTRSPGMDFASPEVVDPGGRMQCVPFAREESGIQIYGDAHLWWQKAADKYERGDSPEEGSVLVLYGYKRADRGHVAVVKRVISDREIVVDHANWLNDGSIYVNNPVLDVSADNDWSQVRVFNIKTGGWGSKIYPVRGFIGSNTDIDDAPEEDDQSDLVASVTGVVPDIFARPGEIG